MYKNKRPSETARHNKPTTIILVSIHDASAEQLSKNASAGKVGREQEFGPVVVVAQGQIVLRSVLTSTLSLRFPQTTYSTDDAATARSCQVTINSSVCQTCSPGSRY